MDMNKIRPASDAAWYCRKDAEEERFYEIFFQLCRKYSVRWALAHRISSSATRSVCFRRL